jgi:carbonic anhydrase
MVPTVVELVSRNGQVSLTHQPLPTFKENGEAGMGPPRIAIISCADPRVTPEKYFNLGPMDAVVFRNVAGHPQSCWKDIAALDTFQIEFFKNSGFEQLIVVHHTGLIHTLLLHVHI